MSDTQFTVQHALPRTPLGVVSGNIPNLGRIESPVPAKPKSTIPAMREAKRSKYAHNEQRVWAEDELMPDEYNTKKDAQLSLKGTGRWIQVNNSATGASIYRCHSHHACECERKVRILCNF